MKKFIKILLCLCLCIVSIAFTACGKKKVEAPTDGTVVGNGGLVVQKGNYIYFANGYVSIDSITKSELDDKYYQGGLYVTKTNGYTLDRTSNGSIDGSYDLSTKLASFDATDLHIFGDYMYFTSINTEETKNGDLQTSHLILYRIKLNGTDCHRVYTSGNNFEDSEGKRVVTFNYFTSGSDVLILVNDNGTLKRVSCSSSIGDATVISNDVLSCVVPNETENAVKNIFYTTTNNEGNYQINRYNISSNSTTRRLVCSTGDKIDSLFASKFGYVYFYATFQELGASLLYRISLEDFESAHSVSYASSTKLTSTTYTSVYLLDKFEDGILVISSSNVQIISQLNPTSQITLQENMVTDGTIMNIRGGYVYFYKDKDIKRWNYTNDTVETLYTETNTIQAYGYDMDSTYLYYYANINSNTYLFRIKFAETVDNNASEIMGWYQEGDAPSTEEE